MGSFFRLAWIAVGANDSWVRRILVIGGGPAGLRAAEICSAKEDVEVILCDQKRSVGRKFLVAGKSGLNLTHGQEREAFQKNYDGPDQFWTKALDRFDNKALRHWAHELGVETFEASSGRVYPVSLKGAPLLRRWIERLRKQGVDLRMNHRLVGLESGAASFAHGETIKADAIILALGGGSWPQTGSDGAWVEILSQQGVELKSFASANSGWEVDWPTGEDSDLLEKIEGQPLKNISVSAGGCEAQGELMVTRYGLEGGPIYKLGKILREMDSPEICIDFKPVFSADELVKKMGSTSRGFLRESKYRWKLNEATRALLAHYMGPFRTAQDLAAGVKAFPLALNQARPLVEAISSAGGIEWRGISPDLMLKEVPGVFVAGEMIDWEAPTGGYLLQGCFASGTLAGEAALAALSEQEP